MAVTLKQTEAIPAEYPTAPAGLSVQAAALAAAVWQRIEAYVVHRWTPRAVVWVAEGCGDWLPPLTPATVATIEVWAGEEWSVVFPAPSPYGGYVFASDGPYRITATVGAGEVPAAVLQAFKRLAEYIAADAGKPGATAQKLEAGALTIEVQRNAAWMARAMINSGAADLLRPYREAV